MRRFFFWLRPSRRSSRRMSSTTERSRLRCWVWPATPPGAGHRGEPAARTLPALPFGPFPEERFQGDLAPSLAGAGARSTEGQLRLRMVDSRRVNPESIMPAYHAEGGLQRVGPAFVGRPVLTAQEIEDVVAYLKQLKE